MIRNLIDLFDNSTIADSFWMLNSLNGPFHAPDWLFLPSQKTSTDEFNDSSWIRMIVRSFRVFRASFIWRITMNFWTSFIAFLIAIARWLIVDDETFISIIRKYASNTSRVRIKSSNAIESLMTLNVICRAVSESMPELSVVMIE